MNDGRIKKELRSQYMEREIVGGVYAVRNTLKNKLLCEVSTELSSARNRFEFSQNTGTCVYSKLQKDWAEQGSGSFIFEVLEELKRGDTQTDAEYRADLDALKEIWLEQFSNQEFY